MADDTEQSETDIWASPSRETKRPRRPDSPRTPKTPKTPTSRDRSHEPIDPEVALRKELEGVRNINQAIEGVIGTLERAGQNMTTVSKTVNNASTLLNTWTRILSQTEHNQRLILHPNWKGTTEDLAAQEAEALQRQQAAERRAAEEEQRREELRRRREEEEEKRRLGVPTSTRGTRGTTGLRGARGRVRTATRPGPSSNYLAGSSASTIPSGRGTSNTSRGVGATRGRSRGVR